MYEQWPMDGIWIKRAYSICSVGEATLKLYDSILKKLLLTVESCNIDNGSSKEE